MLKRKNSRLSASRSARPKKVQSQFQRNSLVISKRQRETELHKQSVAQRQADLKRAREKTFRKRRILIVVAAVLLFAVMYGLRVRALSIRPTSMQINSIDTAAYAQSVDSFLSSKVPLKQSWLIDDSRLLSYLQSEHPEINSVQTNSPSLVGGELQVAIGFRRPEYIWSTSSVSRYIDDAGVLFSKNVYPTIDEDALPVVEDQSSTGFKEGSAVVSSRVAESIAYTYSEIPSVFGSEAEVSSVVLPPKAREIQVRISTVPYKLKLSTGRGIKAQKQELVELLDYMNRAGVQPSEYIDLRVENKLFYK